MGPNEQLYISGKLPAPTGDDISQLFFLDGKPYDPKRAPMGRGICRLDPPEGQFIYSQIKERGILKMLEVGRFMGGSTLLLAQALGGGGKLFSVDLAPRADSVLSATLVRWGWASRVDLIVGNSHKVEMPGTKLDAIFIDGDHSYEGVKGDFDHWAPSLRNDGYMFFHDDAPRPNLIGVWNLCRELDRDNRWRFIGRELSLSLYQKVS